MEQRNNRNKSEGGCAFILTLSWTIAFGILTSDPEYYSPCGQNSSTYGWAVITFYCYIVNFVIYGVMTPMLICCVVSGNQEGGGICLIFITLSRLAVGIMSIVCYGGLVYAYQNEECGSLTTLVEVFVILVSVGLGVICLVLLCMCCGLVCGFGQKFAAMRQQELMLPQPERSNV